MRVALVSAFPPSRHHLSEYGFHLADEMRRQSVDLTVLADEQSSNEPELPGFQVHRCWRLNALNNTTRIVSALHQVKPDIVWFNLVYSTFGDNPLAAFAGLCAPAAVRAAGFRTHVTLHHLMENCNLRHADISFPALYQFVGRFATRLLLRADSVSVLLARYQQELQERYGATNVGVRPHGTLGTPHVPASMFGPSEHFRIFALGKWGRYKRLEPLLQAFPAVAQAVPGAQLLIGGCDHPNRPGYVAALQKEWGDNPQIQFLGYLDESQIEDIARSSQVFAMPYLSSGGPSGVAHIAARFGLPIVSAAIEDFVKLAEEEGLACDTYTPDQPAELAERLIALAQDPARRARMAEQNYRTAVNTTMPRIVGSYLAEFARLRGESPEIMAIPERDAASA